MFGAGGDGGGFGRRVVAREGQDAPKRRDTGAVRVAQRVAAAIDAGRLAVPDAEDALVLRAFPQTRHLATPDRGGGEVLVQGGAYDNVRRVQPCLLLRQLLVVAAERGATIAGDETCRVEPGSRIQLTLQQRQADQRLDAGQQHRRGAAGFETLVEGGAGAGDAAHGRGLLLDTED